MEFTTRFGLHFQATRLRGRRRRGEVSRARGLAPALGKPRSRRLARHSRSRSALTRTPQLPADTGPGDSALGSSRFTRRYWGSPCWFPFLRLLKCFSSAGILARYEVGNRFSPPVAVPFGTGGSSLSPRCGARHFAGRPLIFTETPGTREARRGYLRVGREADRAPVATAAGELAPAPRQGLGRGKRGATSPPAKPCREAGGQQSCPACRRARGLKSPAASGARPERLEAPPRTRVSECGGRRWDADPHTDVASDLYAHGRHLRSRRRCSMRGTCSSHDSIRLAALFIDARAK